MCEEAAKFFYHLFVAVELEEILDGEVGDTVNGEIFRRALEEAPGGKAFNCGINRTILVVMRRAEKKVGDKLLIVFFA